MANKRLKPEEIVSKLRQLEVLTGQGMARLDAISAYSGVSAHPFRQHAPTCSGAFAHL